MSANAPMGSYAWSERTGGHLSKMDFLKLMGNLAHVQVEEAAYALASWLPGYRRRLGRVDFDAIAAPDSKIALDTIDYARAEYGTPLLLHCYRTYYFGAMFAQARDMHYDNELLFVSSLLHDLGLVSDGGACKSHSCFAIDGARRTKAWGEAHDWDARRAIRAYEAVSYHLNAYVAVKHGVEAHLLASGAALDVIGARRRLLPVEAVRQVHGAYPRDSFCESIVASMNEPQAQGTRAGLLIRAGFPRMTERNPLERAAYSPP